MIFLKFQVLIVCQSIENLNFCINFGEMGEKRGDLPLFPNIFFFCEIERVMVFFGLIFEK